MLATFVSRGELATQYDASTFFGLIYTRALAPSGVIFDIGFFVRTPALLDFFDNTE